MNSNGALEKLLHSFEAFYTLSTEGLPQPFSAHAVFKSHTEQYFLVKAARLSEIDSSEHVFFYAGNNDLENQEKTEELDFQTASKLSSLAWEEGLSKVHPYYGHRNTDITLIILSDKISDQAFKKIKKLNYYKSYKFGFYGWSRFKIIAADLSNSRLAYNRFGKEFKKILLPLLKTESISNTEESDSSVI
ncbi:MAG: hypothetical protein K5873_00710 [Treponema sp.]|nr:hypothetical protein [Treponema sp.]